MSDIPQGVLYTFVVTCPKCGCINHAVLVSASPDLDGKPPRNPEPYTVLRECGHTYPTQRIVLHRIERATDD